MSLRLTFCLSLQTQRVTKFLPFLGDGGGDGLCLFFLFLFFFQKRVFRSTQNQTLIAVCRCYTTRLQSVQIHSAGLQRRKEKKTQNATRYNKETKKRRVFFEDTMKRSFHFVTKKSQCNRFVIANIKINVFSGVHDKSVHS